MALRALKTDEETSAIPLDQPVLIELPSNVDFGTDDDDDNTVKIADDDGAKSLQEQFEAAKLAQKASDDRAEIAERDARDARRAAADSARELAAQQRRSDSLEGDVMSGGLAARQSELATAEADLERAFEAGDAKGVAKANGLIGRLSAQIVGLEAGVAEVAERKERPAPDTRKPADPVAAIDSMAGLMPAERDWLKAHQDAIVDPKRNARLGVAYDDALSQGLVRGTPTYFQYLDKFMGYTKADEGKETDVQAPPSRNERSGNGQINNGQIKLTSEEREIAKNMGVSDIEYARSKQQFEVARKADPDKYR